MTLDQYLTAWQTDADLDLSALDEAARNVPLLHGKWWKYYTTERLRYKKYDLEHKALHRQKWEYYLGKMDDVERVKLGWPPLPLKILSANVNVYLDGDVDLQALHAKKAYQEEVLRFIEDVLKQINQRNYHIKNCIDFLRFKNGL